MEGPKEGETDDAAIFVAAICVNQRERGEASAAEFADHEEWRGSSRKCAASLFLSLDSRLVPYHHHAHACQINRPLLNLSELVLVVNVRKVAFF